MREVLNVSVREGKIDKQVDLVFKRANKIKKIRRIKNVKKFLRNYFKIKN
jgi:hypothetical protein